MNNQDHNQEWQTLTQAAKFFGRTRQAIESLVKRGAIEAKHMGEKNVLHINIPQLQMHYASKSPVISTTTVHNQDHNLTVANISDKIDLAATKADNKRLVDLVARLETDLERVRRELTEERKRNTEVRRYSWLFGFHLCLFLLLFSQSVPISLQHMQIYSKTQIITFVSLLVKIAHH